MRKNKNRTKLILVTLVALLVTMISYSSFSNLHSQLSEQKKVIDQLQESKETEYKETYAYAVAKTSLKAGEVVSDSDVDFKEYDVEQPNGFQNRSDVVNKVLLQDITADSMFTTSYIAKVSNDEVTLREGYRALTLPGENFQGKSVSMTTGSYVDIYSASKDADWDLESVRIVSFEGGNGVANAPSNINTASSITFEVPASCISDFISNASKSKLVLVARNPKDKKIVRKKQSYASSMSNYSSPSSLPKLPSSPPISNFQESGLSGLPQPLKPEVPSQSVEIIEANVKSKVTFD